MFKSQKCTRLQESSKWCSARRTPKRLRCARTTLGLLLVQLLMPHEHELSAEARLRRRRSSPSCVRTVSKSSSKRSRNTSRRTCPRLATSWATRWVSVCVCTRICTSVCVCVCVLALLGRFTVSPVCVRSCRWRTYISSMCGISCSTWRRSSSRRCSPNTQRSPRITRWSRSTRASSPTSPHGPRGPELLAAQPSDALLVFQHSFFAYFFTASNERYSAHSHFLLNNCKLLHISVFSITFSSRVSSH